MMNTVVIELPGDPKGKGRPRFGRGRTYTPAATKNYEDALRVCAQVAMGNKPPLMGAIKVTMRALFAVPKSWGPTKRVAALNQSIRPTGRPDTDNISKTKDALNGIVWRDDAQVVEEHVSKRYSESPRLVIEIEEV